MRLAPGPVARSQSATLNLQQLQLLLPHSHRPERWEDLHLLVLGGFDTSLRLRRRQRLHSSNSNNSVQHPLWFRLGW